MSSGGPGNPMGALSIFIARSKVDQAGKGTEIYIEPVVNCCTCPVRLFWKYLEWRGREKGLLFGAAQGGRLSTQAITSICQRMVAAAGLQVRVSSHSLRVGGATAAMMAGLTREQIMTIGGWSSAAVDRYLPALEMTRLRVSARMGL
jgi:site-specific recombinase XerD